MSIAGNQWFAFMLGTLATYRLALLVSSEDGPAFIFRKLRRMPDKGTATKKGLSCPFCISVYASALVSTFFWWLTVMPGREWIIWWLSMSAGAICIHMSFTKGFETPAK